MFFAASSQTSISIVLHYISTSPHTVPSQRRHSSTHRFNKLYQKHYPLTFNCTPTASTRLKSMSAGHSQP